MTALYETEGAEDRDVTGHGRAHTEHGRDPTKQRLLNKTLLDAVAADPVLNDYIKAVGSPVKWQRQPIASFNEDAQDAVGAALTDTATIDTTYNDGAGTMTFDVKKTLDHTWITDFDEEAQDAVGTILSDGASIDFTYSDATPSITAEVKPQGIANPYKFRVHRSAATQALVTGAFRVIQFDTEDFDSNNNFDSTTNYRYIAPLNGFYQFNASVDMGPNADAVGTTYTITLYVNGNPRTQGSQKVIEVAAAGATAIGLTVSGLETLAANDTVDIRVNHNAGANRNANPNSLTVSCVFSGFLVCGS